MPHTKKTLLFIYGLTLLRIKVMSLSFLPRLKVWILCILPKILMKELFQNIEIDNVISFLKTVKLYTKI